MNQEITLTDKWQFIGAEEYIGSQWQKATHVKGMSWEFFPQYFSENKTIGNILETATSPIIKLSILGQEDRSQPLVRYTLQKQTF